MGRRWIAPAGVHRKCRASLGREEARPPRAAWRRDQHRGQKRGDGIGYSGYKHQKGEKVIAITDNNGYVLSPLPIAPVNETDMVLLPDGLKALKRVAKVTDLVLTGAYLNLDAGFDSTHNRKCMFNAGMIPNIKENPRNRKRTKRGRKRLFNAAIHALRTRVDRCGVQVFRPTASSCCSTPWNYQA